ncbi:hypothetical protein HU200_034761 [Digitaria exilis]|uniref:Gnk2-homologous domain-containing protein n=1 Tax=Digitaria exilis TaxID=1010633 RepID=A0A835ENK6_9POAL|nr:hypothetical protein HU200_034761 [Digitaria exilis]
MAQCTRDLRPSDCTACLGDLLAVMYRDVSSVTNVTRSTTPPSVMGFSCYLTYQINEPIHIAGIMDPPPLPSSPPGPPTGSSSATPPVGKMTTVLIAALAAVTLLISVIAV